MTKKVVLTVGLGIIVVGSGMVLVALRNDDLPPATRAARAACDGADRFLGTVAKDGAAETALREIADAIADAKRAVALDQTWVPLQSGLETMQLSLDPKVDDAGSANVGVRVVRANCERARAER